VPAGTGIGSSSTFTVCLLQALYAYKGKLVTEERLAQEACQIEIEILKEPIGKQDQYAASYGGLNYIRFNSDETVFVNRIICKPEIKSRLEKNSLMFYVGNERKAGQILSEQKENMQQDEQYQAVKKMVELAENMKDCLNRGKIQSFGEILHEGWLLKRNLTSKTSSPALDEYYNKALRAGAAGGKLLGAGGGGFLLFHCQPKFQNQVRKALNLRELKFRFENEGSKIIYVGQ